MMKYRKILRVMQITAVSLFFILVGCTVSSPLTTSSSVEEMPTNDSGESNLTPPTSTPQVVVHTPLPATTTLTKSPTATATSTTTPTINLTAENEQTPIPTPPGKRLKEQVLWLYETNNGCQLPCWWGIVPGQTEWQTAKELLERFDQDIYQSPSASDEISYGINIPLPLEVFAEGRTDLNIFVRDGIVEIIDTRVSMGDTPPDNLTQYTLSTFLTTYGQPAEVWLSTYSAPFEHNDLPFRVLLFYPEQGIMALYSDNGVKEGDIVRGCPQQDPVGFLSLWSPALGLTFEQVKNGASVYNVNYLRLENTTTMDESSFYETFKNADNTICLETEAELWRYTK